MIMTLSVYGRTKRPASSAIRMKRSKGSSTFSAAARRRITSTLRSGRGRAGASGCSSITSRIRSLGPPASLNTSRLTTSIDRLKRRRRFLHALESGGDTDADERERDLARSTIGFGVEKLSQPRRQHLGAQGRRGRAVRVRLRSRAPDAALGRRAAPP